MNSASNLDILMKSYDGAEGLGDSNLSSGIEASA